MIHEFTGGQGEQIIGHGHERFQAFVTCILLFVLLNNFLGLIPGVVTPTSQPVVPLGLAVLTFLYYNYHGIRTQGPIGYMKHFAGPVWWMSWLILAHREWFRILPASFAHHPSLRQYAGQRFADAGLLFADSDCHSDHLSGPAFCGLDHPGFCFHAADDDLSSLASAHDH